MKTTVIVPPTYLVAMFGVPSMVYLPTKKGQSVEFTCYGQTFSCKKLNSSEFILIGTESPRARFGNSEQMAEDIGRILETGKIPHCATSMA